MKHLLAVALLASSFAAQAAPFLVSDPWPLTGAQPDQCVYQEGAAAAVSTPVRKTTSGAVYCAFDLAGVARAAHSYQVWGRSSLWGDGVKVPFDYSAAVPTAPTGFRLTQSADQ